MDARGLTFRALAGLVGVDASTIAKWASLVSEPGLAIGVRLAEVLGVHPKDLLEDTPVNGTARHNLVGKRADLWPIPFYESENGESRKLYGPWKVREQRPTRIVIVNVRTDAQIEYPTSSVRVPWADIIKVIHDERPIVPEVGSVRWEPVAPRIRRKRPTGRA
jgi:transcriptional regulator with XRE-family HTH domain